jgi:hypothetical protein
MVNDLAVVYAEAHEERFVEYRAHRLVAAFVGVLEFLEQGERGVEDVTSLVDALFGLAERVVDVFPLGTDSVDLGSEFVLGSAFLGGKIQEVVLLTFQGIQPLGVLRAKCVAELVAAADGFVDVCSCLFKPLMGQCHRVAVVEASTASSMTSTGILGRSQTPCWWPR